MDFVQYQSLSDFGTGAYLPVDFEVAKMQILGKRTVLHSFLLL